MKDCAKVNTQVECGVKMLKNDEGKNINFTTFKSLVGSLRYLRCSRPDILLGVRKMKDCAKVNTQVECGVKILKNDEGKNINFTTFKSLVGSLRYLRCSRPDILLGVRLVSKFIEIPISSNKQSIVSLSTCEAEYVASTSCVCHSIWLRRLLNELQMPK
jgi:DNA-binding Xre family transcriptional regulator